MKYWPNTARETNRGTNDSEVSNDDDPTHIMSQLREKQAKNNDLEETITQVRVENSCLRDLERCLKKERDEAKKDAKFWKGRLERAELYLERGEVAKWEAAFLEAAALEREARAGECCWKEVCEEEKEALREERNEWRRYARGWKEKYHRDLGRLYKRHSNVYEIIRDAEAAEEEVPEEVLEPPPDRRYRDEWDF